jgi:peptide/nickel transport system permease protein
MRILAFAGWRFCRFIAAATIFVLLLVIITGHLGAAVPGDFCAVVMPDRSSAASLAACRQHQPSAWQRAEYTLRNLARGSLGTSLISGQPVLTEVFSRLPPTLTIAVGTLALSTLVGVPLGLWIAYKRHTPEGILFNWLAIGLLAMPGFLLAVLLSDLLAGHFQLLRRLYDSEDPWRFTLPILSLSLPTIAEIMRVTRNTTIRELQHDYVRTGRAKGLGPGALLFRHVWRNVMPGLLGLLTIIMLGLIDGAILIEVFLSHPGLGTYTAAALRTHDYPALQGVLLVIAALTYTIGQSAEGVRRWLVHEQSGGR